jgi:L-lactate utilization protein LutC
MPRDHILHKVRTAIGRSAGQKPAQPPPLRLRPPACENIEAKFLSAVQGVSGKTLHAESKDAARAYAETLSAGKKIVVSRSQYLKQCGLNPSEYANREELREMCATADLGITSADYALADTGTLVMLASAEEARMISLLPPVHLAILPKERILTGLDEFFSLVRLPAERSSSVVFITGVSRTADIEMILVRGVHGPGEIHVVVVSS